MTEPRTISIDEAYDALEDQVRLFHNDCIRRGVKELPIRDWLREFRKWLNEYEFEREYIETQKWLAKFDERSHD